MHRRLAGLCGLVGWLFVLSTAAAAPAEPTATPVAFEWDAPDGCPDESRMRSMVERHLGRGLDVNHSQPLEVVATVRPDGTDLWTVRVVARTPEGERERVVQPEGDCERAAKAAALIVALTIDPTATPITDEAAPEPVPPQKPTVVEDPPPHPDPEPNTTPPPPPSRKVWGSIRGFGAGGLGALPRFDAGFGLAGAIAGPRWRVEAVGNLYLTAPVQLRPAVSVAFQQWTLGVRACGVIGTKSPVEFPLCGGPEIGQVSAQPLGLINSRNARSTWLGLVLSPGVSIVVHPRVALTAAIDGVLPMRRTSFTVEGDPIHRIGPFALRGLLGVDVRFP